LSRGLNLNLVPDENSETNRNNDGSDAMWQIGKSRLSFRPGSKAVLPLPRPSAETGNGAMSAREEEKKNSGDEISTFLAGMQMAKYVDEFLKQDIRDIATLRQLDNNDFAVLKVTIGDRIRIMNDLQNFPPSKYTNNV